MMRLPEETLRDAALVVAHPDDELLWFASILERVSRVVVCFPETPWDPDTTAGRERVRNRYPVPLEYLPLAELRSFSKADWSAPVESAAGLELPRADPTLAKAYLERAAALETALRERLAGARTLFTHNPWGEYGHEDHVQVHRVTGRLAEETGAAVWVDGCASTRSLPLLERYLSGFGAPYCREPVDRERAQELAQIYREEGVWTWFDDFQWFDADCFARGPLAASAEAKAGALMPINLVRFPVQEPPRAPLSRRRRAMRRLFGRVHHG
jgi:hypothetical protein